MNQANSNFEMLNEKQRLAYLQAMDIPVWVPRLATQESVDNTQEGFSSVAEIAGNMSVVEQVEVVTQSQEELKNHIDVQEVAHTQVEITEQQFDQIDKNQSVASQSKEAHTQFLKMVNWKNTSEAKKSLLIVCRHQTDQPAQSFARPGGPSQFMQDYLQALSDYINLSELAWDGSDLQIQLAHLTEAGLSADSSPMSEKLLDVNPDVILLLGDESVRQLFRSNEQVADLRGKLHQYQNYQLLVSYHPYSLICNPELKKLALEDIVLLSKVLQSETSSIIAE